MRIDSKLQYGIDTSDKSNRKQNVENNNVPSEKSKNASNVNQAQKQDAVEISGKVKDTVSITKQLKELPDVRSEKVEELKKQVESGTYNVSGKDIAEKIVKNAGYGLA